MRPIFGITSQTMDVEEQLRSVSHYYMVHSGLPPFLLLHGAADEQVPYQQSPRFCEALKAKGNRCELYTIPVPVTDISQLFRSNRPCGLGKVLRYGSGRAQLGKRAQCFLHIRHEYCIQGQNLTKDRLYGKHRAGI
jgi:acetyl esterase/lipase